MRVFLSWSGDRSKAVAHALHDWLPRVLQAINPWMSESDIEKGTRWEQIIGQNLLETKFGVICLTPENLDSRWINFESGAISKTVERTYLCTYLLDLRPADIEGPLAQFNHTKADQEDTRKLIHTMNRALETAALRENIVDDAFKLHWQRLATALSHLPAQEAVRESRRSTDDMVREILEVVRAQAVQGRAISLDTKIRPRLLSTIDWSPEDARLLSDYYETVKLNSARAGADEVISDFLDRLAKDRGFAIEMLEVLKGMSQEKLEGILSKSNENPN